MTLDELRAIADLMRERCLASVSVNGVAIIMDARGFAAPSVEVKTMVIPPPSAASELFRELSDEELLLLSAPPPGEPA